MEKIHPALPELPIRPAAWRELVARGVKVVIHDPRSTRGGGYWHPDERLVELFTAQEEAAIHEIAHAWWEELRRDERARQQFLAAVRRLSEEADPRYRDAASLAHVYEHGDPALGFPGMGESDWERYAGLASGVMGRMERLPEYVARFYRGLFDEPEDS
ncbi:MAG: hypothetical protein ACM3US_10350 [Sphingomonadaceae bacterium]